MALRDPAAAGRIISDAIARHKTGRRHRAEVTSDRLGDDVTKWHDQFTPAELDMVGVIRHRLEQIAEGETTE